MILYSGYFTTLVVHSLHRLLQSNGLKDNFYGCGIPYYKEGDDGEIGASLCLISFVSDKEIDFYDELADLCEELKYREIEND